MLTSTKKRSPTSSSSRTRKSSGMIWRPEPAIAAAFGARAGSGKFLQMLAKFGSLLAEFLEQAFHVRPVETNLRRARTELVGLQQRRHGRRDSSQNRRTQSSLLRLPSAASRGLGVL